MKDQREDVWRQSEKERDRKYKRDNYEQEK